MPRHDLINCILWCLHKTKNIEQLMLPTIQALGCEVEPLMTRFWTLLCTPTLSLSRLAVLATHGTIIKPIISGFVRTKDCLQKSNRLLTLASATFYNISEAKKDTQTSNAGLCGTSEIKKVKFLP